jgi:hypothetical protein
VSVSAESKPQLASIRAAMDELSAQGATDSPEAQRLVNEYRMATGEAKVDSVIEFLRSLPGLQPHGAAAAAGNGADSDGDAPAQGAAAAAGASSSAGVGVVSNGKVLVFAHHQGVLDAIETRVCEADGLGYIRIDGRTSGTDRQVSSRWCDCDVPWWRSQYSATCTVAVCCCCCTDQRLSSIQYLI